VRTSAFLLERKLKDKNLGVEQQIDRINKGVVRCDNIITQLLDFSRNKQLNCQSSDLDQWLVTVLEEEARKLPSVVSIECHLGMAGIDVPFDPSRMQRAIVNLIANASEALVGQGEDPSKYAHETPTITVSTKLVGDEVALVVADNGPGIPPEVMSRIREPLFTTKSFGTGLGVPAIEQIVLQHGGRLDITSVGGKGAAFSLYLPLQPKELTETEKAA
jgi:signal transduction histidine kinase